MAFIGNIPTNVPLTGSQIANGTIVNANVATNTLNLTQKVTSTLPFTNGGTGLSALGTAGQALVVNSGATALEYSTVGAQAGQVIQVLSTTISGSTLSTTSTSFVALSGLSISITPASSSNKILVLSTIQMTPEFNIAMTIYRGATNLSGNDGFFYGGYYGGLNCGVSYLDSPATTSSTTYQVYWKVDGGTGNFYGTNKKATITVMEVKG